MQEIAFEYKKIYSRIKLGSQCLQRDKACRRFSQGGGIIGIKKYFAGQSPCKDESVIFLVEVL